MGCGGTGAMWIPSRQAGQAYVGRTWRSPRSRAGTNSSCSALSSPMRPSARPSVGQRLWASGRSWRTSSRGIHAGSGVRPRLREARRQGAHRRHDPQARGPALGHQRGEVGLPLERCSGVSGVGAIAFRESDATAARAAKSLPPHRRSRVRPQRTDGCLWQGSLASHLKCNTC